MHKIETLTRISGYLVDKIFFYISTLTNFIYILRKIISLINYVQIHHNIKQNIYEINEIIQDIKKKYFKKKFVK